MSRLIIPVIAIGTAVMLLAAIDAIVRHACGSNYKCHVEMEAPQ